MPRRTLRVMMLSGLLWALAACGGEVEAGAERSGSLSTPSRADSGGTYAVLDAKDWSLQEAIDPPADDPLTSRLIPPPRWYAEYVRSSADRSDLVVLSGLDSSLQEARAELEQLGFDFEEVKLRAWRGLEGSNAADEAAPVVLLLEHGDRALMLQSSDVSADDLSRLADRIVPAERSEWVDAGGVVRR